MSATSGTGTGDSYGAPIQNPIIPPDYTPGNGASPTLPAPPPVDPANPFGSLPGGNPIVGNYNNDPFNLAQAPGPYTAPLVQGQMDALNTFNNNTSTNPLIQTGDITKAIQNAISGGSVFGANAGKSLTDAVSNFQLPSDATAAAKNAVIPQSFDNTELFKSGEQVFNNDLERQMAKIKEEYSGLGLGPGSSDRSGELARIAGNSIANFRLGQQGIASQSFENAHNRAVGAIPVLGQLEEQPYNRYFQAGTQANQNAQSILPTLFDAANLPLQQAQAQYNINDQARTVADTDAKRRMEEYARTQGGGLQQLLAILSGSPENNTAMGPSDLSQIGNFLGPIGTLLGLL